MLATKLLCGLEGQNLFVVTNPYMYLGSYTYDLKFNWNFHLGLNVYSFCVEFCSQVGYVKWATSGKNTKTTVRWNLEPLEFV